MERDLYREHRYLPFCGYKSNRFSASKIEQWLFSLKLFTHVLQFLSVAESRYVHFCFIHKISCNDFCYFTDFWTTSLCME